MYIPLQKHLTMNAFPPSLIIIKVNFKRNDNYTNQNTVFNKGDVRWRGNVVHLILIKSDL